MARTILVVDDCVDFQELLSDLLTPEGYRVVPCMDPAKALPMAVREAPDLILMDLVMPGDDGWQVITKLRSNPTTAGTRVTLCTAAQSWRPTEAQRLYGQSIRVLLKPFDLDELLSLVAEETGTAPVQHSNVTVLVRGA